MPTFCRHNRFIERCPICSKTLPGQEPARRSTPRGGSQALARTHAAHAGPARGVRVRRETRSVDDGYRNELVPGLRASDDARLLADEIGFSTGRLVALAADPPDLYGEVRVLAGTDPERATWATFLIALLAPLEEGDPFIGIRLGLDRWPAPVEPLDDAADLPVGPRRTREPERLAETVRAYVQWVQRAGMAAAPSGTGERTQADAFRGDPGWAPERRFERLFERLALPGLDRAARYELLVLLGRLGPYELRPDGLGMGRGEDPATQGAKRVFGIADPILLERRARALADAGGVPVEALDLALANWAERRRVCLGFPEDVADDAARERMEAALGV
jgi:hypothetical protein